MFLAIVAKEDLESSHFDIKTGIFLYLFATENSPPTRPPPHDRLTYYSIFKSFTEKICEKYELTGIVQAGSLVPSSRWDITTID
jgi:hypothetical protein